MVLIVVLYNKRGKINIGILGACLILIFACIAMGLTWGICWHEYVRYKTWKTAEFTTLSHSDNPYRCCDVVNCRCEEYSGSSCSTLQNNLMEGACSNGYYCCNRVCVTFCARSIDDGNPVIQQEHHNMSIADANYFTNYIGENDYTDYQPLRAGGFVRPPTRPVICHTTCTCSRSVSNRRCDVACGTCYRPVITFEYYNSITGTLVRPTRGQTCSRNNYGCVNSFYSEYPSIGETTDGYYNPRNPQDIVFTLNINMVPFGFAITLAALELITFIVFMSLLCKCRRTQKVPTVTTITYEY